LKFNFILTDIFDHQLVCFLKNLLCGIFKLFNKTCTVSVVSGNLFAFGKCCNLQKLNWWLRYCVAWNRQIAMNYRVEI